MATIGIEGLGGYHSDSGSLAEAARERPHPRAAPEWATNQAPAG